MEYPKVRYFGNPDDYEVDIWIEKSKNSMGTDERLK